MQALLAAEPALVRDRPGQTLLADKNYYGREFERQLAHLGVELLRQLIESVNDTLKGQLDPEQHGECTPGGVAVRILQRLLALTAAISHNHKAGAPVIRSLTAYDH